MPVEVEVHTVPHFKAPVNAKVELWGLECGGTFIIQTSLLKIGCLVHKLGFVATEVAGTVKNNVCIQVQAIGMYGAAQPDFFKSETTWDIKIITTHHLYIYKSCVFTQNLEGVTPKISLPRPWEVWNGQGRGSVIFQDTLFKFCGKLSFYKILNW